MSYLVGLFGVCCLCCGFCFFFFGQCFCFCFFRVFSFSRFMRCSFGDGCVFFFFDFLFLFSSMWVLCFLFWGCYGFSFCFVVFHLAYTELPSLVCWLVGVWSLSSGVE